MIQVRPATLSDLDWLVCQLKEFSDFFGSEKALLGDETHARNQLTAMIENHVVLVTHDESGELTGLIGGILTPHFMNPTILVLAELFWWVAKEYRGGRSAALLLKAFIQIGDARADWITFSLEHHSPVDERCLIKRGFRLQERSYLKEVC